VIAELGYFYNACTQIATQSALLAGFCYSGLTYLTYVDGDICERTCAELIFPLAVITAMCAQREIARPPPPPDVRALSLSWP